MVEIVFLYIRLLLGWSILFTSLVGWGSIASFLIKKHRKDKVYTIWNKLWIGIVLLTFVMQIIHLFLPISKNLSLIIVSVGIVIFFVNLLNAKIFKNTINWIKSNILFVLSSSVLIILISNQTFSGNLLYDFGLYYQQTINWIQSSELVVGLANIHGRFGFNNSSFLLVSIYDHINIIPQSFRIVSSGFLVFSVIYAGYKLWNLISNRANTYYNIYWSLVFVFLIPFIFYREGVYLISSSPDTFVILFEFVIVGILIDMVENKVKIVEKFVLLLLLSGGLFSIKLSAAVFVLFSLLIAIYLLYRNRKLNFLLKKKVFWLTILFVGLCVSIWAFRSVLLTGFPLYPFPKLGFNAEWSVGVEQATSESDWIKSWARMPHKTPEEVLGNNAWLSLWIEEKLELLSFVLPLFFSLFLSLVGVVFSKLKNKFLPLLIIPFSSLVFWFITAPDIRFAVSIVWISFILSILVLIEVFKQKNHSTFVIFFIAIIFTVISGSGFKYVRTSEIRDNLVDRSTETNCVFIDEEIEICEPKEGDRCWNSDSICVPNLINNIEIIKDNDGKIEKILRSN